MTRKTYSELARLTTFEERFSYLVLKGDVGRSTFGFDRYVNQMFYRSREWRTLRHHVIARDLGCDLGVEGYEVHAQILVHHMNPINIQHIEEHDPDILDPEFLITTTHKTHNAIHFGDETLLTKPLVDRRSGDTKLW